jgi:glycosyltransferase involved in cell wall biosynthesis
LHALASRLGIEAQVAFLGLVVDDNLVKQLNRHSLIVIPSIWEEPFGIVALEGIACGCIPVVAQSGGLPEAVGHCGVISKKGDPLDLSLKLESLLNEPSSLDQLRKGASEHLARHTKQAVARSYFQALTDTLGKAA